MTGHRAVSVRFQTCDRPEELRCCGTGPRFDHDENSRVFAVICEIVNF
jgi:hypothetical protein